MARLQRLALSVLLATPLAAQTTTRPLKVRRSLAEGLVRQEIETRGLRPPRAESGVEVGHGQGPIALLIRTKDGALHVRPLERGFGDHGPASRPVVGGALVEEEIEEPVPVPKGTPPKAKPPKAKPAKEDRVRAPVPHLVFARTAQGLAIGPKGKPPVKVYASIDRADLGNYLASLAPKEPGRGDLCPILLSAGGDVAAQTVLTVWELARDHGFRTVAFGNPARVRPLTEEQSATIAGLPKQLGWKKKGLLRQGELLILLDGKPTWAEVAPLLTGCANARIWQLAFVVQKDAKTRFKLPAFLPVDGGMNR